MLRSRVLTRLSLLATVLAALALLVTAAPASAIINGTFDGNRHPNAGVMDVTLPGGGGELCSGVLISPTYFATAAHCVAGPLSEGAVASDWQVTFANDLTVSGITVYHVVDVHYDPGFAGSGGDVAANGHDLGVLHLAKAVKGITPAHLPALHSLDSLVNNGAHPAFQSVGYGVEGYNGNQQFFTGKRNYADTYISSTATPLSDNYLVLGAKQAGLCNGDSGGPSYKGTDTTTVLGLFSGFHSNRCAAWGIVTRLDTQVAHDFYAPYD
jgi:secreted trypsin-like serine protease